MTTPILSINGLCKSFDGSQVLNNISLQLASGEMLFLLGASGCGKTTLLRCIAGFEQPNAGSIVIKDKTVFSGSLNIPTPQRKLGYVVQEGVLFPHLTVYRNIAYGIGNGKGKTEEEHQRIDEVMALTGIGALANRYPHELSGGQQQRVALARALAPNPDLILLDEPFSALDEHLKRQIREEMLEALKSSGKSAVFVTHDREEALRYADKIAVMQQGIILEIATPKKLYWSADSLAVASFIGDNVTLPAKLDAESGQAITPMGVLPIEIRGDTQMHQEGELLFRPEQISLEQRKGSMSKTLSAKVIRVMHQAKITEIYLDINGVEIILENHFCDEMKVGQEIDVYFNGKALFF